MLISLPRNNASFFVRILNLYRGVEWRRAEANPTALPDKILRISIVGTDFSGRKSLMHALCVRYYQFYYKENGLQ